MAINLKPLVINRKQIGTVQFIQISGKRNHRWQCVQYIIVSTHKTCQLLKKKKSLASALQNKCLTKVFESMASYRQLLYMSMTQQPATEQFASDFRWQNSFGSFREMFECDHLENIYLKIRIAFLFYFEICLSSFFN